MNLDGIRNQNMVSKIDLQRIIDWFKTAAINVKILFLDFSSLSKYPLFPNNPPHITKGGI